MTKLWRSVWRLFVDSPLLAAAVPSSAAMCALARHLGLPAALTGWLLLLALGSALAASVRAAITTP